MLFEIILKHNKHCLKYQSFVTLIPLNWQCDIAQWEVKAMEKTFCSKYMIHAKSFDNVSWGKIWYNDNNNKKISKKQTYKNILIK